MTTVQDAEERSQYLGLGNMSDFDNKYGEQFLYFQFGIHRNCNVARIGK